MYYNILIIEDSKLVSKILEKKFTAAQQTCSVTRTFLEASDLLKVEKFDFIILDLNLPDAYGEELVDSIQKLSDAKIFVLTVEKDLELREALYKDGILDYLVKDKYFDNSVASMLKTMQQLEVNKEVNILSIDDSRFMREQIKKILQIRNYNVFTAENVSIGFELINKHDINLIVLDMELSDRNGIDVLRELKFNKKYEHIPILILSGTAIQETVRECLKLGAFDFIKKPFNIEEFTLKVDLGVSFEKKTTTLQRDKNRIVDDLNERNLIAQEYQEAINKSNILVKIDTQCKITDVNEKFYEISGYTKEECIGKTYMDLCNISKTVYTEACNEAKKGNTWTGKITNKKKNGTLYHTETTVMPVLDTNNKIIEYLWMSSDITEIMSFHFEIEDTQKEMIYKMGEIAESRSEETGNHIKRVAECCKELALLYGLEENEAYRLYYASPMHDIGKVAISDEILKKPSKLTKDEWKIMQTHSSIGYYLFKNSKRPILQAAAIVAHEHHEKYDGSGYPLGLKGKDIHIYGRIIAIADVFDALLSPRVYKNAWGLQETKEYFEQNKGKHFDPILTQIFLDNFDKFVMLRNRYKDVI